jgi:hypothetical protein
MLLSYYGFFGSTLFFVGNKSAFVQSWTTHELFFSNRLATEQELFID